MEKWGKVWVPGLPPIWALGTFDQEVLKAQGIAHLPHVPVTSPGYTVVTHAGWREGNSRSRAQWPEESLEPQTADPWVPEGVCTSLVSFLGRT